MRFLMPSRLELTAVPVVTSAHFVPSFSRASKDQAVEYAPPHEPVEVGLEVKRAGQPTRVAPASYLMPFPHYHFPTATSLLCYPTSKSLPGQDFELRLPGNDKEHRRKAVQVCQCLFATRTTWGSLCDIARRQQKSRLFLTCTAVSAAEKTAEGSDGGRGGGPSSLSGQIADQSP